MVLTGCATGPVPPVYRKEELEARCERTGGGGARTYSTDIASTRWPGRCPEIGHSPLRGDDREGERGWEPTTLPAVLEAYFSTVAARGPVGVFYEHQFGHDGTDQASVLLKPGSMILDPQRASRYGRLTRPAQQTGSAPPI